MALNSELIIPVALRWIHIGCAMIAVGGPFFVRFALMPAAGKFFAGDDAAHQKLRETINARWRHIVNIVILLFIATGLYNFLVETRVNDVLVTARWKAFSPADKRTYHMLFGIKMLAAFAMFFLASALAGRSATFAPIRKKAKVWVTVLLMLGAVVLACSNMLRYLPTPGSATVATQPK